ncbi:hypothetical protein EDD18DRAFT_1108502 [Armillaria luteobubalina]|uniref:Uncharacterized protein n=1 Tax=Armillaria luteobubalina TaxID=153913 RepID=A0AA39PYI6_9AGAR|nr:hypothetical protein EDD18DRAFT_1108502 [Armillaria luteobubalina]
MSVSPAMQNRLTLSLKSKGLTKATLKLTMSVVHKQGSLTDGGEKSEKSAEKKNQQGYERMHFPSKGRAPSLLSLVPTFRSRLGETAFGGERESHDIFFRGILEDHNNPSACNHLDGDNKKVSSHSPGTISANKRGYERFGSEKHMDKVPAAVMGVYAVVAVGTRERNFIAIGGASLEERDQTDDHTTVTRHNAYGVFMEYF